MNQQTIEDGVLEKKPRSTKNIACTVVISILSALLLITSISTYKLIHSSREEAAQLKIQLDGLSKDMTELKGTAEHYLIVAEWGLKIPQNASRDLYYKINGEKITFGSLTLDKTCNGSGIDLARGKSDTIISQFLISDTSNTTFEEVYKNYKSENKGVALFIRDYYYLYPLHGPDNCTADPEKDAVLRQDIQEHVKLMRIL